MLKVTPRGKLEELRGLSEQEDRALRDAFSRWPARSLGAAVVGAYQRLGAVIGFCATARARAASRSRANSRIPYGTPVGFAGIKSLKDPHKSQIEFTTDTQVRTQVCAHRLARKSPPE